MLEKTVESKYPLEAPDYVCATCAAEIAEGATYISAVLFEEGLFLRRDLCADCWSHRPPEDDAVFAFWKTSRPTPEVGPPKRRRFDVELIWSFFLNLVSDLATGTGADEEDEAATQIAPASGLSLEDPQAPASSDHAGARPDQPGVAGEDRADVPGPGRPVTPVSRREKVRLCFLLALLLVRGKRLVLEGSVVHDGREWLRLGEKGHRDAAFRVEDPHVSREDLERVKETLGQLLQMEI